MEEVAGTAKLVDPAAVGAGSALTATLPRTDIEVALQDEAGADLFLEIARIQNGERNDRRIKVAWSREDLETLLQNSNGETVSCTFDADELERMLNDPDFEAHGLREKAAIITVAIAGAAAIAGNASAMTQMDGGATPAPAAVSGMVTDNSSAAVPGAVTGFVTDASSAGVAAPADTGTSFVTDTTSGGQPGAVTGFRTDASTSGDTGAISGLVTDTGAEATRNPAEPSGGGGISIPGDALGGAALAGGIALLLTGAAVVGRSRRGGAHPA
jgi:hypothetical protein